LSPDINSSEILICLSPDGTSWFCLEEAGLPGDLALSTGAPTLPMVVVGVLIGLVPSCPTQLTSCSIFEVS
jgi:hypothetical protein